MNESIIKSDRRGRLRYTAEHKQALVEAYEASGLSGPKFAELQVSAQRLGVRRCWRAEHR